jgi:hypothetical protein
MLQAPHILKATGRSPRFNSCRLQDGLDNKALGL